MAQRSTRVSGSLQLSAEGAFVTVDGYSLIPEITVPNDSIEITINPQWSSLCEH